MYRSSDSSMDDKADLRYPITTGSTVVQIPLWTIRTEFLVTADGQ